MKQKTGETLAVKMSGISKSYGPTKVLDGFDLNVPKGAVYGFLGANGAGKTTTMKILCGILKADDGKVECFGESWGRQHLKKIGALIEYPMLYVDNTGYENLKIHALYSDVEGSKKRIAEVLDIVGLDDRAAKRETKTYSLGMKQRLGIAISLIHSPELLILDEPQNGLDIEGIREIRDLIGSLSERGITILVSSHAIKEIEKISTHIGIIAKGKMRFEGTKSEFMSIGSDVEENYFSLIR